MKIYFKPFMFATLITASLAGCSPKQPANQQAVEQSDPSTYQYSATEIDATFDKVSKGSVGINVGQMMSGRTAYVFFDPRCNHCGDLFHNMAEFEGKVHVVWVPVARLGPLSGEIGASILGAPIPLDALKMNEENARTNGENYKINPDDVVKMSPVIDANSKLLREIFPKKPIEGVPFTLYKNNNDPVKMMTGAMLVPELKIFLGL
jgi:hypothetical protein